MLPVICSLPYRALGEASCKTGTSQLEVVRIVDRVVLGAFAEIFGVSDSQLAFVSLRLMGIS